MQEWFQIEYEVELKLINTIMSELEQLITDSKTANCWIDERHNIFAYIDDNGNGDSWIEIHYELYDCNEDHIGDLIVLATESVDDKELRSAVIEIVKSYFGS